MNSTIQSVFSLALVFAAACGSLHGAGPQNAGEPIVQTEGQASLKMVAPAEPEGFEGRLPRYYASLVDNEQRAAIYQIQAKYHQEITALVEQLNALKKTEAEAIENVLTASQRKQLLELRTKASQRLNARSREPQTPAPKDTSENTLKTTSKTASQAAQSAPAADNVATEPADDDR